MHVFTILSSRYAFSFYDGRRIALPFRQAQMFTPDLFSFSSEMGVVGFFGQAVLQGSLAASVGYPRTAAQNIFYVNSSVD
jgi:hypothetical protein